MNNDESCPYGMQCIHTQLGIPHKHQPLLPLTDKYKRALKLIDKQLEGEPVYTKPAPEDFRCFNCRSEPTCPSAWDMYNTGGDCLEEK